MDLEVARENMIKQQIRVNEVLDDHLLTLLSAISREDFVPQAYKRFAFADMQIPIDHEQVMWVPADEARALQALAVQETDLVLEVGTGTGYLTTFLAILGDEVESVEIFPELTLKARARLEALDIFNVDYLTGDAARGWQPEAQEVYDVICLTGSVPILPTSYRTSLNIGGRLFYIEGSTPVMTAKLVTRVSLTEWTEACLFETFVPPLLNAEMRSKFVF